MLNFSRCDRTQNDAVRTLKINSLFSLISIAQRELLKTKNGKSIQMNQFSDLVIAEGFEPSTACLEGRCSIQLSYATFKNYVLKFFLLTGLTMLILKKCCCKLKQALILK